MVVFRADHRLLVLVALALVQIRNYDQTLWILILLARGTHRREVDAILAVSSTTVRCLV